MTTDLHAEVAGRLRRAGQRYTSKRRALVEIVPEFARSKTERVSWGANVDAFRPAGARKDELRRALGLPARAVAVLFHHLVCSNCGSVKDVSLPSNLERRMEGALTAVASSAGFTPAAHRLDVIGICGDCA